MKKKDSFLILVRTDSGIREFDDIDSEWLIIIDSLKKTGMPLKEIRDFVKIFEELPPSSERRQAIIARHRAFIEKRVAELNDILLALDFKQKYYSSQSQVDENGIPIGMKMEDLPPKLQEIRSKVRGD